MSFKNMMLSETDAKKYVLIIPCIEVLEQVTLIKTKPEQ